MNPHPILGCLLGVAVGDSIGLPTEGLSRAPVEKRTGALRHRLICGRGMCSDDTEHTLMVGAALRLHSEDPAAFQRALAGKLRWWLAALPAGVGLSTAKAILRLWLGFPASRAGVKSAGNGAAMRSAILGCYFRENGHARRAFTLAGCRVTHTDARAEESAMLVAEAAALAAQAKPTAAVLAHLHGFIVSHEMKERFTVLQSSLQRQSSVAEYAAAIGCGAGVSGFAPNTVAVALYAWLRHRGDFRSAVTDVIRCGGDTDTVASITGGICGAECGEDGIPRDWISGIFEFPRSIGYVRQLADALENQTPAPGLFWPLVLVRNAGFLVIVLAHGVRRLVPW